MNYSPDGYNPQIDPEYIRQAGQRAAAKRRLRRLGNIFGVAVLAVTLLTELVSVIISGMTYYMRSTLGPAEYGDFSALWNGSEVQNVINIVYSAVVIGGTFLVVYLLNKSDPYAFIPFGKPAPAKYVPLVIIGALGAALAANMVTGYIDTYIFDSWGSDVYNAIMPATPDTALGMILYVIAIVIIPPMIEEFALRGVVMQPLRRFGDGFALIASAFLFAALHSSPIQMAFAFAAGLFFGYADIVTGSLWTSIIIHCLNNAISVVGSVIVDKYGDESKEAMILSVAYYVIIGIAAVAVIVWFNGKNRPRLKKYPLGANEQTAYTQPPAFIPAVRNESPYRIFFLSPGMLIAYICVIWRTFETFASLKILGGIS